MTIMVFILTVALFSISKELYLHVGKKKCELHIFIT